MNLSDVQMLLAEDSGKLPHKQRMIGAGQAALKLEGFNPGKLDGFTGPKTDSALRRWQSAQQAPGSAPTSPIVKPDGVWVPPRKRDMTKVFGRVKGPASRRGRVQLAYTMRWSWELDHEIQSFPCHALLAQPMTDAFRATLAHYGIKEIKRLGLDLWGGCYNPRPITGSTTVWSKHAWGAAVDIHPQKNAYRWGPDRAVFAREEYKAFLDIFEAHGLLNMGRHSRRQNDWMHFQGVQYR